MEKVNISEKLSLFSDHWNPWSVGKLSSGNSKPPGPPSRIVGILRWASILCLFLIVHLTHNRLAAGLAAISSHFPNGRAATWGEVLIASAPFIKALLFLLAMVGLAHGIAREAFRSLNTVPARQIMSTLLLSAIVTVILAALVVPAGNVSMGEGYAARSMRPFEQDSDWYHKRLLMPATAYMLFFRGDGPYFAFGFLITVIFIALLQTWLRNQAPIPRWQLVSLCTSSFVIYQFQKPGYPDILVFCFLLGVMFASLSQESKVALLVLALLTHEASLFVGIPLAWRYLDRRHQIAYLSALSLYGFLWLASSRFRLDAVLGSHNVEGLPGIEWVLQHPWLEVAGIFFAFKALWLLPVSAIHLCRKQGEIREVVFIVLCVAATILLTTVGVDSSRMAGYAFPAILVSLKMITSSRRPPWVERALSGLFAVNLLIPSFSVGLNVGITPKPGLYREAWRFIKPS